MINHFNKFRKNIIGIDQKIKTPCHDEIRLIYTDWAASGRMYNVIEEKLKEEIYPLVANTHTDTSHTGMAMTYAYHKAKEIIKEHVGANQDDILISSNSGMTGVVNKFQRILGLKIHESFQDYIPLSDEERPIVFVTHMEHHSNQTSWNETIADVVVIPPLDNGLVDLDALKIEVHKYKDRKTKIAAITSCSNVTGIIVPYMEIAKVMHHVNGLCFVDFASSAPYININMHQLDEKGEYLDAIYFSPHKFLGGPGSSGVLIFNKKLYHNRIPDNPGGGTVDWTNPWGEHKYVDSIEAREDGGTPSFLQTIRAAMCLQLKSEMGVANMQEREEHILSIIWQAFDKIPNLHVLANQHRKRLGIISFNIDDLHYNLGVRILNDRFGMQTRGGCSCAGTYGHYLLNVTRADSKKITDLISAGDCSLKPGWIRLSIHPTHSDDEIHFICESIKELAENHKTWSLNYAIDLKNGTVQPVDMNSTREMEENLDACLLYNFA